MSDERILARLPELSRMHFTAEVSRAELRAERPRIIEVTRILGTLCINAMPLSYDANAVDEEDIEHVRNILDAANSGRVGGNCRLALWYLPWAPSTTFPVPNAFTGAPPGPYLDCFCETTGGCIDDPRQTCRDADAVEEYEDRIDEIVGWLDDAGIGSELIAWQIFDTERWTLNPAGGWNTAIRDKHNAFYNAGKTKLPDALIHHYERAGVAIVDHPLTHAHSPVPSNFYGLNENGDVASVSLYQAHDLKRCKKTLEETVAVAVSIAPAGDAPIIVTPWVGLACGFHELAQGFELDLNYGVRGARDLAHYLRHVDFSGVSSRVTIDPIALYPQPFYRYTPRWLRYFIEYARAFEE